jgi:hypothetical protein
LICFIFDEAFDQNDRNSLDYPMSVYVACAAYFFDLAILAYTGMKYSNQQRDMMYGKLE